MSTFVNVIGVVGALLVLALAVVGAVVVHGLVRGDTRRTNSRARDAEQHIRDIGREAQLRIMHEALRRASRDQGRTAATFDRSDRRP